jgi:hypothetical protein
MRKKLAASFHNMGTSADECERNGDLSTVAPTISDEVAPGSDVTDNPQVYRTWLFRRVDGDSEDWIVMPASVYCPNKRTVATASKVTGTHIPPS